MLSLCITRLRSSGNSIDARFRDELLDGEIFYTLDETLAQALQYGPATLSAGIQATTGSQNTNPSRPEAHHALTKQLDHSVGANQGSRAQLNFSQRCRL